jgi:putative hydrolase of the HAD superfamily
MSTRWIVFDAVGTLMYPTPKVGVVYHEIARRHGSQLSEREIAERFAEAFASSEQADLGTTSSLLVEPTTSEEREFARWREIVAEVVCDIDDTSGCFEELFEHFGKPSAWDVFPDIAPMLDELNAVDVRLAIASNFDARLHSVCEGHPVLQRVETRFVSSEIGFRKPALQFFSAIQEACASEPHELLMIGDGLANDVQGALDAGWQAIHIERSAKGIESKSGLDQNARKAFTTIRSMAELLGAISS